MRTLQVMVLVLISPAVFAGTISSTDTGRVKSSGGFGDEAPSLDAADIPAIAYASDSVTLDVNHEPGIHGGTGANAARIPNGVDQGVAGVSARSMGWDLYSLRVALTDRIVSVIVSDALAGLHPVPSMFDWTGRTWTGLDSRRPSDLVQSQATPRPLPSTLTEPRTIAASTIGGLVLLWISGIQLFRRREASRTISETIYLMK